MSRIPEPTEAIDFLGRKKIVETERWDDLQWGEHSHAFTVAHSTGAGVLDEIYGLMDTAMRDGTGFGTFKRDMRRLMRDKGWYGRSDKSAKDKKYVNWRLRTMYETNIATAFSAGKTRKMLRNASRRPWWIYKSLMVGENRREAHKLMHNTARRYDDPFWDTYDPPNGWGCKCTKVSASESGVERLGGKRQDPGSPIDPEFVRSVPQEWRYSPGREAFAPDFSRYQNLANHFAEDGKSVLRHVKDSYRDGLEEYKMSEGEWKTWSDRVLDDEYGIQHVQVLGGVLNRDVHRKIDQDPKMMVTDKALRHGSRPQKPNDKQLPRDAVEGLPKGFSNPSMVFRQRDDERIWHFVYDWDESHVVRTVFRKQHETTSFQLLTYMLVTKDSEVGDGNLQRMY